jgi:hypothetical protein
MARARWYVLVVGDEDMPAWVAGPLDLISALSHAGCHKDAGYGAMVVNRAGFAPKPGEAA